MPSYSREIKIPGRTSQDLYDLVSRDIDRFADKAAQFGKFEIDRNPGAKSVSLKSSMVTATLNCLEGCLKLDAKLSLLATPFRSKIDDGIDYWIKKTFQL